MSHYLGIDLGTYNNFITKWNDDKKHLESVPIFSEYGAAVYTFPNMIYYEKSGNVVIGKTAYNMFLHGQENIIRDMRRNIGLDNNGVYINNLKREVTAEQAVCDFASYVEANMRKKAGDEDLEAVISVPYNYTKRQKNILKHSVSKSGVKILAFVESPVAVLLGFGILEKEFEKKNVMIFNIGAEGYTVSLCKLLKKDDKTTIDIVGVESGDKGGKDIDELISEHISKKLVIDAKKHKDKVKLRTLSESIKEHLSYFEEYDENPIVCNRVYKEKLTAVQLASMIKKSGFMSDILDSAFDILDRLDLMPENIDDIILSGGTSNIPFIKEEIEKFFQKRVAAPKERDKDRKVFEGEGAGLYCGMLKNNNINFSVIHRTENDIKIKCGEENKLVLPKGTEYGKASQVVFFRLSDENKKILKIYDGKDLNRSVKFSRAGFIGVQLETNEDGELMYKFFDAKNRVVAKGMVGG